MSTNLTHDDVESILKMIDAAEHHKVIEISHAGFRLHVIRSGGGSLRPSASTVDFAEPAGGSRPVFTEAAQPIATSSAAAPVTSGSDDVPDGAIAVRAPMLGVFYRASAPGEKPFVEVGQGVCAQTT